MDSLMNVYKWFRKNRIVSSQPAQQVRLINKHKHVLANISRSRCNTRSVWTKWNGFVADNVAHAAGASILSLVRACVRA